MAKKKAVKKDDINEDDLDELLEEEIESVYPKLEKSKKIESEPTSFEEAIEEEEFELEEEPRFPDYKYLNLKLSKGESENDYELLVEGQSHGFCNIFVNHLLNIEGVNIAAYKFTNIEPAKIFIRLEDNYKIKDILHKGIELLRLDVLNVQKLFKKLM